MKPPTILTYKKAIIYGLSMELILIGVQFIFLKINMASDSEATFAFTTEYMMNTGFFIFQILGFFLYTVVIFIITLKFHIRSLMSLLTIILTGGVIEQMFYLVAVIGYEAAFIYSVLDKFMAAGVAAILFFSNPKQAF